MLSDTMRECCRARRLRERVVVVRVPFCIRPQIVDLARLAAPVDIGSRKQVRNVLCGSSDSLVPSGPNGRGCQPVQGRVMFAVLLPMEAGVFGCTAWTRRHCV